MTVPKRIATAIINSLKGGVVPRIGLEYIAVGRKKEIDALLNDIEIIENGGATFRFIVGKYGSGKSFLLQIIRNYAMDRGFVVADADLSPERRFVGTNAQGLATYKELMKNMSTKTRSDGGALSLILERWISTIKVEVQNEQKYPIDSPKFNQEVTQKIFDVVNEIEGMVNGFDFGKVISMYWDAYNNEDDDRKSKILKWLRGEFTNKTEAKQELGINVVINNENWYDYLKIMTIFLIKAGYKGLIVLIDELINIYKLPNSVARQYNYEKILNMYNDTMQGKAKYIGIIMGGTPQSVEDTRKGVFSYDALKSRLEEGKFSNEQRRDLLAPIIRLDPLTYEEMCVLVEKLAEIHAELYNYALSVTQEELIQFIKFEYSRIGANVNITPREIIRDFIELLNIIYQYPEKSILEMMKEKDFKFAENTITDESLHVEFQEFEV